MNYEKSYFTEEEKSYQQQKNRYIIEHISLRQKRYTKTYIEMITRNIYLTDDEKRSMGTSY